MPASRWNPAPRTRRASSSPSWGGASTSSEGAEVDGHPSPRIAVRWSKRNETIL